MEIVQLLLRFRANTNHVFRNFNGDYNWGSAPTEAARAGNTETIDSLSASGASVDLKIDHCGLPVAMGTVAMVSAAQGVHVAAIHLLLSNRTRVDNACQPIYTMLCHAVSRGNLDCVLLLIQNGAAIKALCEENDHNALMKSAANGCFNAVKYLVAQVAAVRDRNKSGHTSLC